MDRDVRHRPRLDATQRAIVAALRRVGCTVQSLASVGGGCPDLLVGAYGRTILMECKSPKSKPNAFQQSWFRRWRGGDLSVVFDAETALAAVGVRAGERASTVRPRVPR